MIRGKASYLNKLYSRTKFKSVEFGEKVSGSSPPTIFVGREGYPKVYVGPLLPNTHGDTSAMDTPEEWLSAAKMADDIIDFRFSLVRGKKAIDVRSRGREVQQMQEIALAKSSVGIDAEFSKKPKGGFFHEDMQPFGPSAPLKDMEVSNGKMNPRLEKFYHDTDARAKTAVLELYEKGVFVSTIQKSLSVGAFGLGKNRKLVPTRWSITAVDDTVSKDVLDEIRTYPVADTYQVYEFTRMNNYFSVLLMPTRWQYENIEAFIRIFGNEELVFGDWEPFEGKKEYAAIGGCYYSARLAIAEKLQTMKVQAGAIVFREVYPGYTPLGVWLVRECMRKAMNSAPKEFHNRAEALSYIGSKTRLPFSRYQKASTLLKQRTLKDFAVRS